MERYHFNLYDGLAIIDDEGTELASLAEARKQAIIFLGSTLADSADTFFEDGGWRLDVTDRHGTILFVVNLSAFETAAVASPTQVAA